jgi:hypothetical protein
VAEALQHDDGVEVGSVNCIAEPVICQNWCVPFDSAALAAPMQCVS